MIKLLLIGFGIMLLIEGFIYGFFPKSVKQMMKKIITMEDQKIRNIVMVFCVIGFFIIYFIIRY